MHDPRRGTGESARASRCLYGRGFRRVRGRRRVGGDGGALPSLLRRVTECQPERIEERGAPARVAGLESRVVLARWSPVGLAASGLGAGSVAPASWRAAQARGALSVYPVRPSEGAGPSPSSHLFRPPPGAGGSANRRAHARSIRNAKQPGRALWAWSHAVSGIARNRFTSASSSTPGTTSETTRNPEAS